MLVCGGDWGKLNNRGKLSHMPHTLNECILSVHVLIIISWCWMFMITVSSREPCFHLIWHSRRDWGQAWGWAWLSVVGGNLRTFRLSLMKKKKIIRFIQIIIKVMTKDIPWDKSALLSLSMQSEQLTILTQYSHPIYMNHYLHTS